MRALDGSPVTPRQQLGSGGAAHRLSPLGDGLLDRRVDRQTSPPQACL